MSKENITPETEAIEVVPAVDILEKDGSIELHFEVPGANAETVSVEVDDGVLRVAALSSLVRDGRQIEFKRRFQLSDQVDVERITARTADGVLTLELPKSARSRVHKIVVS